MTNGESGQTMKLKSKTVPLHLLATANDPESGVQALEILVNKTTTSRDANGLCSTATDVSQKPRFASTSPQKKPGETTGAASIMAQVPISPRKFLKGAFRLVILSG